MKKNPGMRLKLSNAPFKGFYLFIYLFIYLLIYLFIYLFFFFFFFFFLISQPNKILHHIWKHLPAGMYLYNDI